MADQVMTITPIVKGGILDVAGNANAKAGNAAAGNNFLMPNNGHTFLAVSAVTGDTITFTAVANKYGRTETLAPVMASGKFCLFGPFPPHLWNNGSGQVIFKPTAGNVGDKYLAVDMGTFQP